MRPSLKRIALAAVLASPSAALYAQTAAAITGIVTDATGAVVPGTKVVLSNPSTGVSFTAVSDNAGSYRFPNVPANKGYTATFTHEGFSAFSITDLALQVGITRTTNATLTAGAAQEVSVSGGNAEVTINTTDATIGNNFDVKMVNDLPIQDRGNGIQTLFSLQPGVNATGSVTGARADQNSVTLDGMDLNDIAAGQAQAVGSNFNLVGGAPADAVQEFRGTVAGLTANEGTGSGGQFQLVTKNGTNSFHGDLNEYHRDVSTAANSWFNLNLVTPLPRPKLIRNQFGGAIGGPVIIPKLYNGRDKLFFFFDFNNSRLIQQSSVLRTVPLDSFRNGIVGYTNNTAGCSAASRRSNAPQCISELNASAIQTLDPAKVGENATLFSYINTRYPHANDLSQGDGINTGGYRFQQNTNQILYNYVGRVDYNLTPKQKVFAQYHTVRSTGVQALSQFDTDPLTYPNQNQSYGYVASHVWNIGQNKVNQFYYGDNVQIAIFPVLFNPTNSVSYTFAPLTAPNGSLSAQNRRIPIPEVRDDFNWTLGRHTLQFGGTFKFIKTNSRLTNDYPFITVGIGGLTTALDPSLRPANVNTNATTVARYDQAFALSLGRIAQESRNYNYNAAGAALPAGTGAVRRYRYYQTEAYFGDTWKATPNLTFNYGVRYQYYSVPFEANGTQSNVNLSFDQYVAARQAQSAASSSGNTAVPLLTYSLGGSANNGTDIYNPSYKDLAPHFGFAYNPAGSKRTVLNGSFGLQFDRTVVNAVNFVQDQLSYLFQNSQTRQYGGGAASTALTNDPRLGANLSFPAVPAPVTIDRSTPYAPYVDTSGSVPVPFGTTRGQVNYAVDKNLKTPYSLAFNAGIQHQLPGGFVLSASYAGRLGRRLIAQADASQMFDFRDPATGQTLNQAFSNLTTFLRNDPTATAAANRGRIPSQPFFESLLTGTPTAGYPNKTAYVATAQSANVQIGDFGDTIAFLAQNGYLAKNIAYPAQFLANTFITNKGYAAYHAGLLTLTKNYTYGLQFQFNYTYAHSTDNVSAVSNYIALNTGTGQICDVTNRAACYGNSDFDIKHTITSNFTYDLPVGRGRMFGANMNRFLDLGIGGWKVSGIPTYRSGVAFATQSGAFLAGDYNNVPGIFNGDRDAVKVRLHKDVNGALQLFDDPARAAAAFSNPVGFQYGSRNNLRGPSVVTFDAGIAKVFQIVQDKLSFQLRGDGFNVLNHPTFATPSGVNFNNTSTFGTITATASSVTSQSARVIQVSGRLEF